MNTKTRKSFNESYRRKKIEIANQYVAGEIRHGVYKDYTQTLKLQELKSKFYQVYDKNIEIPYAYGLKQKLVYKYRNQNC